MRKATASVLLSAVIALVTLQVASANIAGTKHDFSTQTWSVGGQICLPCHTPHGGNKTVAADAPLWNHSVTSATYTLYSSRWLNHVEGQPTGVTKLCLSCHDGTVARDAYRGGLGTTMGTVRTDRRSSHPISFLYDTALATADGYLNDPSTFVNEHGKTIGEQMLRDGNMHCVSCHAVHNEYNNEKLLLIENEGSKLCLTCHAK